MAVENDFTLDVKDEDAVTNSIELTGNESIITMWVFGVSGQHNDHEIALEISPNDNKWIALPHTITGIRKSLTEVHAAQFIRAKVVKIEVGGGAASVDVFLRAI